MAFVKGQSGNPGGKAKVTVGGRTLTEIAREHTEKAVQALVDAVVGGESGNVRVAAATALLDRGWGRPAQSVTLSGDADSPLHLSVSLDGLDEAQLRALASIKIGD